jgi:hypothetical protein
VASQVFFGPNASTAVAPQALQDALTTTTGSIDVIAYSGGVQAFATALGQLSEATPEGLKAYRAVKNRQSIDRIPALSPDTSIATSSARDHAAGIGKQSSGSQRALEVESARREHCRALEPD